MRKLKSLKGKTRKKTGFVELEDDIVLPVKTLSVAEEVEFNFDEHYSIPVIQRRATQDELEEIKKDDPSFNSKIIPFIKVYDKTSPEYAGAMEEKKRLEQVATVIKYIDMEYVNEEGQTLWQDFEIEEGNFYELAKYFAYDFNIAAKDLELILIEIKALQGESVYEKLSSFEKMTKQGMIKILNYVYDGMEREDKEMRSTIDRGIKAMEMADELNNQNFDEE